MKRGELKRGDVVVVGFPYTDGRRGKNRPALVVQNDRDNRRLSNTIVVMITGNIRLVDEETQFLIDPSTSEGKSSGLRGPSAVKCNNLVVVVQEDVQRVIGQVSPNQQAKADFCLKAVFDLA